MAGSTGKLHHSLLSKGGRGERKAAWSQRAHLEEPNRGPWVVLEGRDEKEKPCGSKMGPIV
jgi:hypothetical protein